MTSSCAGKGQRSKDTERTQVVDGLVSVELGGRAVQPVTMVHHDSNQLVTPHCITCTHVRKTH